MGYLPSSSLDARQRHPSTESYGQNVHVRSQLSGVGYAPYYEVVWSEVGKIFGSRPSRILRLLGHFRQLKDTRSMAEPNVVMLLLLSPLYRLEAEEIAVSNFLPNTDRKKIDYHIRYFKVSRLSLFLRPMTPPLLPADAYEGSSATSSAIEAGLVKINQFALGRGITLIRTAQANPSTRNQG